MHVSLRCVRRPFQERKEWLAGLDVKALTFSCSRLCYSLASPFLPLPLSFCFALSVTLPCLFSFALSRFLCLPFLGLFGLAGFCFPSPLPISQFSLLPTIPKCLSSLRDVVAVVGELGKAASLVLSTRVGKGADVTWTTTRQSCSRHAMSGMSCSILGPISGSYRTLPWCSRGPKAALLKSHLWRVQVCHSA